MALRGGAGAAVPVAAVAAGTAGCGGCEDVGLPLGPRLGRGRAGGRRGRRVLEEPVPGLALGVALTLGVEDAAVVLRCSLKGGGYMRDCRVVWVRVRGGALASWVGVTSPAVDAYVHLRARRLLLPDCAT